MPKIRGVKPDYWTDEDIVDLTIPARLLFIGLWSYACDNGHLQDKPKQIKMRLLPGDDVNCAELLRELEAADRILRAGGWIIIPKFTKHQRPDKRYFQTCDKPGCERPPADSQPGTRGGHDESTTGTPSGLVGDSTGPHVDGDGDGEGELKVRVTPTRALARTEDDRPELAALCNLLADSIANNGSKRPAVTKRWLDSARLMIDNDGRTVDEIRGAIVWSQADEFWRSNILSMPKLREKYDQLRLAAQRPVRGGRQQETDALFDRAMARARAMGEGA